MRVGTFEISRAHGGFDIFDTCTFNPWGSALGFVTIRNAITWAAWAEQFKRGRTFQSLPDWQRNESAQALISFYEAQALREVQA